MAQASKTARSFRKIVRERSLKAGLDLLKSGDFDPSVEPLKPTSADHVSEH